MTPHAPVVMSEFAKNIMEQKYSHTLPDGLETWENISYRTAKHVMKSVGAPKELTKEIQELIRRRVFMPGGRYLYATGRAFHQTQNCLLLRAEDSREGWSELMQKVTMALMTGAGIGVDYSDIRAEGKPIRKTGGTATGPLALMQMVNEAGRGVMQGGARRSAIWAGLNWNHADIHKFINLKNWSLPVRQLKEADYNFPATMDGTNISVLLDDLFFKAYHDEKHNLHTHAHSVYWAVVGQMLKTGEPGFSVNLGKESKETLRNAPVCGETMVLTREEGYIPVRDIVGIPSSVWTGNRWANNVVFKKTNNGANILRVNMTGGRTIRCDETHPFLVERYEGVGEQRHRVSVVRVPANKLEVGDILHVSMPDWAGSSSLPVNREVDSYALGYCYGDGSFGKAGNAEITFCTDESKKCVEPISKSSLISSIATADARGYTRAYFRVDEFFRERKKDIFPEEMFSTNFQSAVSFIAGLFDADGNWEPTQKRIRLASIHEGFLRNVARLLEQMGILAGISKAGHSTYGKSQTYQLVVMGDYTKRFTEIIPTIRIKPILDDYIPYRRSTIKVCEVIPDGIEEVFCADVGVEEHSFMAEGVIISNCTEVTSEDDSDICNLGSINMAQINSLEEMQHAVDRGIAFLLAGTVYSDVPYSAVDKVRQKNRRLGLGLLGLHEWLLVRGKKYGPDAELEEYLKIYATSTELAGVYAKKWDLSAPVKTRAIAPTGTIGIVAETTTGMEPIFCAAYKRRYRKGTDMMAYQYVIDPTAKKLVDRGVNPDNIEDAYTLAEDVERRVAFQAWLQKYVDHSISSTINLPEWGSELNNSNTVVKFGKMLIKYLPELRGITCYPDGARGGQPLTPVKYATAIKHTGEVFYESTDVCDIVKAGSCG